MYRSECNEENHHYLHFPSICRTMTSTIFPYTTLFRSRPAAARYGSSPSLQSLRVTAAPPRSEEHTSELQSHSDLVCRLLLEKKKTCKDDKTTNNSSHTHNTHSGAHSSRSRTAMKKTTI